jgi:hypothetical protein
MTIYTHKAYGEVKVTPECISMQRKMKVRGGFSSGSMLVEHKGNIIEVSKDLVTETIKP